MGLLFQDKRILYLVTYLAFNVFTKFRSSSVRSIDRGHRDLSTGNRPTRFTMESGLYSPSRIGEDRIAAKARFEEDGCWSCVRNIQRRFVIAKFFLLRNRDCVRTDRRTMYNRLLLFLRFV